MLFKFFCDESYDSPVNNQKRKPGDPPFEPRSYVVGGMFGDQDSWGKVEGGWKRKNDLEGVPRFHAVHLNHGTYEYDGWSKPRRVAYSKEMLKILKRRGKRLHGVSIGLFADEYRSIINADGQRKWGHPYLVCFKTAVALVASQMDYGGFYPEDQVEVILDRNDFQTLAVEAFYAMKDDPGFKHRHRLATCTPADSAEIVALQVGDFVAYETFKLMHGRRLNADFNMRPSMRAVLGQIGFLGLAMGTETLTRMKDEVENSPSRSNGTFIIPPFISEEEAKAIPHV